MAHIYNVGFLFDKDNSWINSYFSGSSWLPMFENKYNYKELWSADEAMNFDILFILGYTKIISASVLSKNSLNLVIHESDLPLGRGFSPVQWQVLEGASEIPVCLIEASQQVDEGDIVRSTLIRLAGHELFDEIRYAQAKATKELIIGFLQEFPDIKRKSQVGQSTYYRRRNRNDDKLDVEASIMSQFNKLRIADNINYPLYFELMGHTYELSVKKVKAHE